MKVMRCEQQQIRKDHPVYSVVDKFCLYSKNLYNEANYVLRHEFIYNNHHWIHYRELDKMFQSTEQYHQLMSQASQCTLQVLDRMWRSYFVSCKEFSKNPNKFLGMPHLPKYKKTGDKGRFIWFLKNNQIYFEDGWLWFKLKVFNGYKFKTHLTDSDRIVSIRFVPRGSIYILEISYETEVPDVIETDSQHIAAIDLGVNNFVTMTNNIGLNPIIINGKGIKSINQFYNKRRAEEQSRLMKRNNQYWSKWLNAITLKRNNKIKNYIHHASKYIVDYCVAYGIDTLVCGLNKTWKQEMNMTKIVNQKFQFLPFNMLIKQLAYKCQNNGIKFITNEESYTSGTSFLDGERPIKENYDKSRRVERGLFKSSSGLLINSDVNGSYQIMTKVFPDAITDRYGIEAYLTPIKINATKVA